MQWANNCIHRSLEWSTHLRHWSKTEVILLEASHVIDIEAVQFPTIDHTVYTSIWVEQCKCSQQFAIVLCTRKLQSTCVNWDRFSIFSACSDLRMGYTYLTWHLEYMHSIQTSNGAKGNSRAVCTNPEPMRLCSSLFPSTENNLLERLKMVE